MDSTELLFYVCGVLLFVYLYMMYDTLRNKNEEYSFSEADRNLAKYALRTFREDCDEVSNEELNKYINHVVLAKFKDPDPNKEDFNSLGVVNTRYWPKYYYSFPYNYKYGTPWPRGLFSRMYNWTPGFNSGSGWSYYLRPGNDYYPAKWPRNRWIRNNGNYYYISNRGDYAHDAANYNYLL